MVVTANLNGKRIGKRTVHIHSTIRAVHGVHAPMDQKITVEVIEQTVVGFLEKKSGGLLEWTATMEDEWKFCVTWGS